MVKVVQINTNDVKGGAAKAVNRLNLGLGSLGYDSTMYVLRKEGDDPNVAVYEPPTGLLDRVSRGLRRYMLKRCTGVYPDKRAKEYELFSLDRSEYGESMVRYMPEADLVNLHWVAGFLDFEVFFKKVVQSMPIVWTMHDMNAFTGGCHYDDGCQRFNDECGACPQLGSVRSSDLSREVWKRKKSTFDSIESNRLHLVSPSKWLADLVASSRILGRFPVEVIPNGVDIDVYAPRGRKASREILGIPKNARVALFVADVTSNRRKGIDLLVKALKSVKSIPDFLLLSIGRGESRVDDNVHHLHLGHMVNDRWLAMIYSAADLFVIPSRQDNLPNTVLESLACGTPIAGFDIGGISDMVRSGVTGMLAPCGDSEALGNAIEALLADDEKRAELSANCRRIAIEEYSLEVQGRRYADLYQSVLEAGGST